MTRLKLFAALTIAAALAAGTAAAHEMDHPAPAFSPSSEPASTQFNSGGEGVEWELISTIATGNPHSDLDFFTHKGDTYASVGTLGTGPNGGGQTIVRLTEGGEVKPSLAGAHPSAACPTASSSATGLQHDVEAAPKGDVMFNAPNRYAVKKDAELLVDTTDAPGRCHDQGALGIAQGGASPNGGLEIIDVTDPAAPKELALTVHIGNAHTVNVDPKRPHIAFDVTQDGVAVDDKGVRANDTTGNQLDGFEVVDMSSCMGFLPGTSIEDKRKKCRPQVYRYRYPSALVGQSHTYKALQSCHELEIYEDDTVTCASIDATAIFDLSGAFDDNGTPTNYADDKPRGTPLPCKVRESETLNAPFATAAPVIDCMEGERNGAPQMLTVSEWLKIGAPSLEGVKWVGTVPHMGFGAQQDIVNTPYDSTKDLVAAHESERTESGRFVISSDERGGGVLPGGATCSPGADNVRGNGGLHFFPVKSFTTSPPRTAEDAHKLWARTKDGEQAVYRAPIRTGPQGSFCTAHVFQLIPGQNRIFMGWYSQGTQVIDFTENADGTLSFTEAGYFTPENANTWVSAIFRAQRNNDGTYTYWGATGDGIIAGTGRGAIDIYKVTMAAPPTPAGGAKPGGANFAPQGPQPACASTAAFASVSARPRGRGLRFGFDRVGSSPVNVDLFQQSVGRRIVGERRVKRFRGKRGGFAWNGRGKRLRNGWYFARFSTRAPNGSTDVRRVALQRVRGRFRRAPEFDFKRACGLVTSFKLERPVFGGAVRNSPLNLSFRLNESASVVIDVRRGGKLVKRTKAKNYAAGRTHRVRIAPRGRRGLYTLTLRAERPSRKAAVTLKARRL